ncbi:MAG: xanthine dehydrogenase family protein subunit M [Rhizobiales bacterium]|nr:xanthine dehydrogenase family protein subunit M [Hyphomicrobiales bacterium]
MKPAIFRYHAPKTLHEAVAVLADVAPDDGRVLAGGQSLVPIMAFRLAKPAHLVDINGIKELAQITAVDGKLRIGACVRHAAFYEPVCDGPLGKLLATVVRSIAHHPIRTRGTFCGSVAHADPASEWCTVVATLDGEVAAQSKRGQRIIAAKDYFAGIMTTVLEEDELLTEVRLPLLPADTRVGFQEFSRRAGDFALSMAVVTYRIENGKMADARVGIGGAEPYARRIVEAEAALDGKAPDAETFQAAAVAAAAAIDPLEDFNTSAEYRRDLVRAMTRRALDSAAA